ncbi:STAS domain-containing protein [Bacillus sp. FJAT-44742]|uniref:STAS domain-containing protein n=1 Tax=Bacillus sp. FJAT-44742 TaxID=2014005 RepID=UPI000C231727|nr:STAS domain-containing protein [Bacillus sp. FJAT-44742]
MGDNKSSALHLLSALINENRHALCTKMEEKLTESSLYFPEEEEKKKGLDTEVRGSFFSMVGDAMISEEAAEPKKKIEEWAVQTAYNSIDNNVDLNQALLIMPMYRDVLEELIKEQSTQQGFSIDTAFFLYKKVNHFLDYAIHAFSYTFVAHHIKALELAKQEMQEISVPVVPIKKGVAVLPIIGDMDDERSEYLQSKTLDRAAELSLSYIIIDLSGINTINTWFAQHLLNLIHSLQLLGIETSITGMRPELSQTIVHLGITFKGVPTYLTLEQALSQSPYMK